MCACIPVTTAVGDNSVQHKICISRQVVSKHRQTHSRRCCCKLFCPIRLHSVPPCMVFRCQIWLAMPDYDSYYPHYFVINSCLPGMLWYVLRHNRALINMSDWYRLLFCCCQKEQLYKFMPVWTLNKSEDGSAGRNDKKIHLYKTTRQTVASSQMRPFFPFYLFILLRFSFLRFS